MARTSKGRGSEQGTEPGEVLRPDKAGRVVTQMGELDVQRCVRWVRSHLGWVGNMGWVGVLSGDEGLKAGLCSVGYALQGLRLMRSWDFTLGVLVRHPSLWESYEDRIHTISKAIRALLAGKKEETDKRARGPPEARALREALRQQVGAPAGGRFSVPFPFCFQRKDWKQWSF